MILISFARSSPPWLSATSWNGEINLTTSSACHVIIELILTNRFDFASFGALADVIGELFFPKDASATQLLKSLSIFGAAFLMRPVGGLLIGFIGDSFGRKRALEISILLMIVPSFFIGILPTFHQWGWTATAALVVFRLLQGLACGGEIVGAFIYTIEATKGVNRGFWGGCCKATGNLGSSLGLGMVAILRGTLSNEQLLQWGWRIPFLLSLVFGVAGIRLRAALGDDDDITLSTRHQGNSYQSAIISVGKSTRLSTRPPQRNSSALDLWLYWREIVLVILVAAYWSACYYSCFVWMMYFMSKEELIGDNHRHAAQMRDDETRSVIPYAWVINFSMNLGVAVILPLGGYLGDLLGGNRSVALQDLAFQRVMMIGLVIGIIVFIPAFALICTRTTTGASIGQALIVLSLGIFGGNLPAFMVSQFEMNYRFKGVGFAYNIAHALFSSTAPIIQTALVMSSADHGHSGVKRPFLDSLRHDARYRPAFYLIFIATVALLALCFGAPYCKRLRDERKELEDLAMLLDSSTDLSDTIRSSDSISQSKMTKKSPAAARSAIVASPISSHEQNQLYILSDNETGGNYAIKPNANDAVIAYPIDDDLEASQQRSNSAGVGGTV
jgi:MFS transporter, MHS family, proline/betaine transporter